ncbi:MAG: hypothetical protein WA854_07300, partial [Candidatus Binataceae bacterium]
RYLAQSTDAPSAIAATICPRPDFARSAAASIRVHLALASDELCQTSPVLTPTRANSSSPSLTSSRWKLIWVRWASS